MPFHDIGLFFFGDCCLVVSGLVPSPAREQACRKVLPRKVSRCSKKQVQDKRVTLRACADAKANHESALQAQASAEQLQHEVERLKAEAADAQAQRAAMEARACTGLPWRACSLRGCFAFRAIRLTRLRCKKLPECRQSFRSSCKGYSLRLRRRATTHN